MKIKNRTNVRKAEALIQRDLSSGYTEYFLIRTGEDDNSSESDKPPVVFWSGALVLDITDHMGYLFEINLRGHANDCSAWKGRTYVPLWLANDLDLPY